MRNNPGEKITPIEVAELFHRAFARVATIEKAIKRFDVTGKYPVNHDIFSEEDLAPAAHLQQIDLPAVGIADRDAPPSIHTINRTPDPLHNRKNKTQNISLQEIIPISGYSTSSGNHKQKRTTKKQHPVIFTSTR
ncbi:hypothetical protein JTB14_034490 [Gonioctena quinquepunctata]|nr:hypothetical protein JTB14_034490 [Gonioctena quinquepunctata]